LQSTWWRGSSKNVGKGRILLIFRRWVICVWSSRIGSSLLIVCHDVVRCPSRNVDLGRTKWLGGTTCAQQPWNASVKDQNVCSTRDVRSERSFCYQFFVAGLRVVVQVRKCLSHAAWVGRLGSSSRIIQRGTAKRALF
jgi:hypothetical protein